jgi:universal stress protein A
VRIRRILAPTDFSDPSAAALEYAAALAQKLGARLIVTHVVEPITGGDMYGWAEAVSFSAEMKRHARRRIAALVATLSKRGIRNRGLTMEGFVAQSILEAAKSVDLIVMGTHGRSGVSRLLIGSIAEKVVRGARCPVLTVRIPSKEDR